MMPNCSGGSVVGKIITQALSNLYGFNPKWVPTQVMCSSEDKMVQWDNYILFCDPYYKAITVASL